MRLYFKILNEVIKKSRKQTAICFIIMMVMSVLQVMIPLAMKSMITRIEQYSSVTTFIVCIFVYALMWFCYNMLNVKWYKHIDILGERVLSYVRKKLYHVIWNCEYDCYDRYNKEYLKNVLFTDVINIYGNIILYSLNIISNSFMIIVLLCVSFYVDIRTTVILTVTVGIGLIISAVTKPIMASCSLKVNKALKKDNAINNECIDATELIRTNGLYEYYLKRIETSIKNFISVAITTD